MFRGTISGRGQVVIPAEIRNRLHIKPGTPVSIEERNGEVRLVPITPEQISRYRGMFKGLGITMKDLQEERRMDDESLVSKAARRVGQ
jgi:AbrB family looped-hinge helix DNA binding protein